ncbi:MAG: hypothetical protein EAZ45_23385 [Oscillatoriales cyanobacterium]|nr:MAG: hypothetical protein EAZ45_23385 [Oscillatoriales cyanobacterium]
MLAQTTETKTGEDSFLILERVLHSEAIIALIKGQLLAIRVLFPITKHTTTHYIGSNTTPKLDTTFEKFEKFSIHTIHQ